MYAAQTVQRRAGVAWAATILIFIALAGQLPTLTIDTAEESCLHATASPSIARTAHTDTIEENPRRPFAAATGNRTGHMALFVGGTTLFVTSMAKWYRFAQVVQP